MNKQLFRLRKKNWSTAETWKASILLTNLNGKNFKKRGTTNRTSHPSRAVPYGTRAYFTSVFEMGTGGTRPLWSSQVKLWKCFVYKAFGCVKYLISILLKVSSSSFLAVCWRNFSKNRRKIKKIWLIDIFIFE